MKHCNFYHIEVNTKQNIRAEVFVENIEIDCLASDQCLYGKASNEEVVIFVSS